VKQVRDAFADVATRELNAIIEEAVTSVRRVKRAQQQGRFHK
jgi:hypothetical protein